MAQKKMKFKTELTQLLHLITHSLYSHREVFLRELISNACDAIDKVRFEGLTNDALLEDNSDWKIVISTNEEDNTLTITDNGIGRKRSASLKTKNQKKQKSKGMGNIKKRIAILNDMYKNKVEVAIQDYKPDGTGTRVILKLKRD